MSAVRLTVLAGAALALTACASMPMNPYPTRPPAPAGPAEFRPGDFAWSAAAGRNTIGGRLAYRTPASRYTCAGQGVVLTPETPWTRRRMSILYGSPQSAALPVDQVRARTPSAPEGDYSAFVKRTTCDANDRFSFAGLPNGAWFVITLAKPAAGGSGPNIAIMRRVETRGGKMVVLDL